MYKLPALLPLLAMALMAACTSSTPTATETPSPTPTPTPIAYRGGTLTFELVAPDTVSQGETLNGIDILVHNAGDPITFVHCGSGIEFTVSDAGNNEVYATPGTTFDCAQYTTVGAGGTAKLSEFGGNTALDGTGTWDLRDSGGNLVPAGVYYIQGWANIDGVPGSGLGGARRLLTEPKQLVVFPHVSFG